MRNRQLDTSQAPIVCAVCARSLLRGEHANVFIAGGARRDVCELCTTRAAHEGWIRDGADAAPAPRPRGGERARSLMGRVRSRLETPAHQPDDALAEEPDVVPRRAARPAGRRPAPAAHHEPVVPQREIHAVPTNAELKVSRALELFNNSEHPKTVSGVARSLGAPDVSVGARSDDGALVEIVVAWELCWYRYEVDLADEPHAVRLLGQGYELSELGEGAGPANAVADGRGALVLSAA
ncbi:MAG TPA: hypothetical protein VHW26_09925 [Solirubrobacteraceae bacterium]|nr:hypothetical protein [Solirubrobacteraceae bacterium]